MVFNKFPTGLHFCLVLPTIEVLDTPHKLPQVNDIFEQSLIQSVPLIK